MKKVTDTMDYKIERVVESFILTEDIAIVRVKDVCEGAVITDTIDYCHPNNISKITDQYKYVSDSNYKDLAFMKLEFERKYLTYPEPWNLTALMTEYGIDTKTLWESLVKGTIDIENYIPVQMSFYNSTIYPFVYGKDRYGWFPHMIHYAQSCYHITNYDYDLEKVLDFLLAEERDHQCIIERGSYSWYGDGGDVAIREIPSYNVYDTSGTEYINFMCLVNTAEEYEKIQENVNGLNTNVEWKKKLKPFAIERD